METLASSESGQTAFENAIADNVAFLESSAVTFLSVTSTNATSRRRSLRGTQAVNGLHHQSFVELSLESGIVSFHLLFYAESLGYSNATLAQRSVYSALERAIESGALKDSLVSFARSFNVSSVFPSTVEAVTLTLVSSSVSTPSKDSSSSGFQSWPTYGKVILPIGAFLVFCIAAASSVFIYRCFATPLLEKDATGTEPVVQKASKAQRNKVAKFSADKSANLSGVERQFSELMLAEEFGNHNTALKPVSGSMVDNPVRAVPTQRYLRLNPLTIYDFVSYRFFCTV